MSHADKKRLDQILVDKNISFSRENAKRLIMSGKVFVEGKRIDKPGTRLKEDASIEVKGELSQYVSRGGLKLEKALKTFSLDIKNKICLDVGASTGGFTHCLLLNGARYVYALDVGYGQLAWKLRCNDRVEVLERTNIRYITRDIFKNKLPEFACVDLSFISLAVILPKLVECLVSPQIIVLLIKPQFELERNKIGKKGVVREKSYQYEAIRNVMYSAYELGFELKGLTFSPIKGPKGNIEFLANLVRDEKGKNNQKIFEKNLDDLDDKINQAILDAHKELSKC